MFEELPPRFRCVTVLLSVDRASAVAIHSVGSLLAILWYLGFRKTFARIRGAISSHSRLAELSSAFMPIKTYLCTLSKCPVVRRGNKKGRCQLNRGLQTDALQQNLGNVRPCLILIRG